MKLNFKMLLSAVLLAGIVGAGAQTPLATTNEVDLSKVFKTDKEKFSYWIGMYAAAGPKSQIKRFDLEVDYDTVIKAFKDAISGEATLIPEAQMRQVGTELNAVIKANYEAKSAKAKAEGVKFLEENKKKPGVITLPSGLQYQVITEGTGTNAAPTDELAVNYKGMLPDGTEFDSSKPGKPLTTTAQGRVINGWKEVLPLMKVGSKWKVFIPTELAYGERPPTPLIPANSPLVFEMELVSAKPVAPPAPALAAPPGAQATPLTSDIIKVPSKEEMDKGAKVETIKAEDLEKAKLTNAAPNH